MAKFTVEDILSEYSADGKRSGIQRSSGDALAHGTLETEKLVNAATSKRPMQGQPTGYRAVSEAPVSAETEEELVDIKSTISQIRANKAAKAAREQDMAPVMRERFPTQHLQREKVSFLQSAAGNAGYGTVSGDPDGMYDGAVKVSQLPTTTEEGQHRPSIRQMEDSTRAREKNRRRRGRKTEGAYAKESVTGEFQRIAPEAPTQSPSSKRHWEEEPDYYYEGTQEQSTKAGRLQRVRSHAFGDDAKRKPDDMAALKKVLHNLRSVVLFRFLALLLLTLLGVGMAVSETVGKGMLEQMLTGRGYALVQLILGAAALVIAFPTVKNGLFSFFCFHADSDSMAVLPLLPAIAGAVCAVISPEVLGETMVHLYVPCALMALLCNAVGRLLVVRRALRNCNIVSKEGQKRVLSYISQEETAELFTRGVLSDYPIVTAVRKADALCDVLQYTYSKDIADTVCRPMTPICAGLALLISVGMTVIRMGVSVNLLWISCLLSLLTMFLTASCCVASALVANLPLEWESRKAAASDSAMLGYQSVDDFFDTNALLAEATDLFPKGSVQIQGMKVFSGAKVDSVLLDAASLVTHAGSMLQNAFSEMIPDKQALHSVEEYVCEDGLGLCGWIANRRVLFGGREMMASHNVEGLPTKTREAELAEGNGDVLYLSVSGVLSAMFSVRISADPMVRRQMQALKQEKIVLVLRSIDSSVTLKRLSALFDFPEHAMKILPTSMHNLFDRETAGLGCVSASMTVGGSGFGAARLLLGARNVRRASMTGVIVQIVSALLGLSLAVIHVITGSYEALTAQFFCLYHLILTAVTILAVKVR